LTNKKKVLDDKITAQKEAEEDAKQKEEDMKKIEKRKQELAEMRKKLEVAKQETQHQIVTQQKRNGS